MRALPSALAPWARELTGLPADVGLTLLPWLQRIDAVLGQLGRGRYDTQGEPDGYDGLHTRGPYHRLLASQWLLADEQPDEFLRRAAMNEHTFLRLARRVPQSDHAIVALLDAGPEQLGAPRIGHLAALIVLARRAARVGARFLWAQLSARDLELNEGLGPEALRRWLTAKSIARAAPEQLERWQARLDEALVGDDRWLIAAPMTIDASSRDFAQLAFESPLFEETSIVRMTLRARGERRFGRAIDLPLPAQPAAVRLLRDPFSEAAVPVRATPAHRAFDVTSPPRLSIDGRSVTLKLGDGSLISYPFPNSPNATPGKPRSFRPPKGHVVLGATRIGKRLLAITQHGNSIFGFGIGSERAATGHDSVRIAFASHVIASVQVGDTAEEAENASDRPRGPLGVLLPMRTPEGLALALQRRGVVIELVLGKDGAKLRRREGVLAIAADANQPGYLSARRSADDGVAVGNHVTQKPWVALRARAYDGAVFLSGNTLAVQSGPRQYVVKQPDKVQYELNVPRECIVHAALDGGLVCSEQAGRLLVLLKREGTTTLARASSPMAHVDVAFDKPLIVYATELGELVVIDRAHDAALLRIRPAVEDATP